MLRIAVSAHRTVHLRSAILPIQPRRECSATQSLSSSSHRRSDQGNEEVKSASQGLRITDKRTSSAPAKVAAVASSREGSAKKDNDEAASVEPLSNEELLKKRMRLAQQRLEKPIYTTTQGEASSSNTTQDVAPFFPASTSSLTGANSLLNSQHAVPSQSNDASTASSSSNDSTEERQSEASGEFRGDSAGGGEGILLEQDGVLSTTITSPSTGALQGGATSMSRPARITHPFDTHAFVERLLQGGFSNRSATVAANATKQQEEEHSSSSNSPDTQLLHAGNPHDPAEALMQATRHLLITRSEAVLERNLNKTQVENEAYLFSAALSELRTELQVRARSDAAALRSITTLLQREVDGLSQRMSEEINTLKHDIAVDMNNRKGESQQDTNSLEQEIQDLQNRFTLSLGDLRVEIEESIRWGATRRALGLFFGIAIIVVTTLWTADYMTRGKGTVAELEAAVKSASEEGLNLRTKTSEELGLEEKYNDLAEIESGGRHV